MRLFQVMLFRPFELLEEVTQNVYSVVIDQFPFQAKPVHMRLDRESSVNPCLSDSDFSPWFSHGPFQKATSQKAR
jgi:hypothetical protein